MSSMTHGSKISTLALLVSTLLAACSGAADDGSSGAANSDGDSDAGSYMKDSGARTRDAGGAHDGGAHDAGSATNDAGQVGGDWKIESFSSPDGLEITQIATHPTTARRVLLGFASGVFSTAAAEWNDGAVGAPLTVDNSDDSFAQTRVVGYAGDGSAYVTDWNPSGAHPGLLLQRFSAGTWTSLDMGSASSRPPQAAFGPWPPVVFVPSRSSARFLANANETLFDLSPSEWNAASWPQLLLPYANTAETAMNVSWLAFDPADDTRLVVGIAPEIPADNPAGSAVVICTVPNPPGSSVTCTTAPSDQGLPHDVKQGTGVVAPSNASRVYMQTADGASLYRSDDSGGHFTLEATPDGGGVLAIDPLDADHAVICAALSGKIWVSHDGAGTWSEVTAPGSSFTCGAFDAAGTYFAAFGAQLVSQKI